MSSTTTVLITGANRGIGQGLVSAYLGRPNTTVVAAVRNIATAESLRSLPKSSGSQLIVIEIDVASSDSIRRGIRSLTAEYELDSLDIVIANAGMAVKSSKLIEMATHDIQPFVDVNAYGQLELFRAVLPLLRRSKKAAKGKFMYMSSIGGSLTTMDNMLPAAAYGASKALGNFFVKWLSLEQKDVVIWAQHPGLVATETAKAALEDMKSRGPDLTALALPVEQVCHDLLHLTENATLETTHGKFLGPDGEEPPW
ncbi:hypothetical protein AA0120_g11710 [Alternaria tenuissima]|uniref:Ketoreductase (KR) domain-containing protein n=1 Tax=Alternaria tenuissima TaxID=119927 RepID=A0A4Q4LZX3_9PLEO|nr:hypothetical protein AA0114_g12134 [Alternaria tenuissima]RYN76799.1 hypothetical protein AA0120_g11710 [Alternaria tenuissima]